MNTKIKKTLSIFTISTLLVVQVLLGSTRLAFADVAPTPPAEPTPSVTAPTPKAEPTPSVTAPTPKAEPTPSVTAPTPAAPPTAPTYEEWKASQTAPATSSTNNLPGQSTGGGSQSGQVGGTSINTGDATFNAQATTTGNSNILGGGSGNGSASVSNDGNGAGSANVGTSSSSSTNTTGQGNSATVGNNIAGSALTGANLADGNTTGNNSINTGNANTSGTAITAVNTNVDGVRVSEFNVNDDHVGDIIISPTTAAVNCVSGCGGAGGTASNTGNGAGSTNTAGTSSTNTNNTGQNNDATVGNNLVLASDSGNNSASHNTTGDNTVNTGNANVEANSLTFANNNIEGNVQFNTVNIFGNLNGDIVLSDDWMTAGSGGSSASNTGNGTGSRNTAGTSTTNNNNTSQTNNATIENKLTLNAGTGNNSTSGDTGGNEAIQAGDANVTSKTLNVANSNVDGGTWWLVIINRAGHWIGKIMGSPDGSTMAGSAGTEFEVGADGQVTASNNSGNGSGSTNTASNTSSNTNNATQNNNAHIVNNLDLSANTGGNLASHNTGGSSSIKTGSANIIANLVNFVNNNIVGKGKLIVTVVNVFGNWIGDLVTPGQHKSASQTHTASSGNNSNTTSNNGSGGSTHSTTTSNGIGLVATFSSVFTHIAGNTNGGAGVLSNTGSSSLQKVAGISTDKTSVKDIAVNKHTVILNLAWILLFIPLMGVILLGRKIIVERILTKKRR